MKLRDARAEDLHAVASLHVAAWRAAYTGIVTDEFLERLSVDEFRARRESRFHEEQAGFLVAEDGGKIVGFVTFGASRDAGLDGLGEIYAVYVDPAVWQRGVGSALLIESCARLARSGFRRAALWVLRDNTRARRFYEKHGWALDGHEKQGDFGGPVVEVRYRRAL